MAEKKIVEIEVSVDINNAKAKIKDINEDINHLSKNTNDSGGKIKNSLNGSQAAADRFRGGLSGISEQFVLVGKAAKTSSKAMKSALISSGVGALIVLVGILVEKWDDIVEFVKGTNKELERQNNLLDINRGLLDQKLKFLENEKKYNDENNISNEKLIEKQKKLLSIKAVDLKNEIANLKIQFEKEASLARQQTFWENLTGQAPKITEEEAKALSERKTKIVDLSEDLKETLRLYDDLGAVVVTAPAPPKKTGDNREKVTSVSSLKSPEQILAESEAQIAAVDEAFNNLFNLKKWQDEQLIDLNKNALDQIGKDTSIANAISLDEAQKTANSKNRIDEIAFNNKQKTLSATAAGLSQLSNILGQETGKGKALAVAGALIDTYAAIAGQLRAFSKVPIPGYAIAQAVVTGLSGFAAVKNILKVQVPNSQGTPGVSSISTTPQVQTPRFNIVGQSGVNQLAESIGKQESQPIKAYLTSNDVTTAQGLQRNIVLGATID